ncbi:MAG: KdsC family phosphatase [Cyclobacteriaceae bacterium]
MAGKIKLFLSDIDGVLTDGGMYYTEQGDELKRFCVYDGMGLQLLQQKGIKVGLITAEDRMLNQRRYKKLKLDYLFQGAKDKLAIVENLCNELSISLEEVAYIGDDVNDISLLGAVGLKASPPNAMDEVKQLTGIIKLKKPGGQGAVREFIELIISKNLYSHF